MKIVIVGVGYVGLVSAVCYASMGHDVICYDIDKAKIDGLQERKSPIHEDGLDDLLADHDVFDRISFTADLEPAVDCDLAMLAVGTPPLENGSPNMSYIYQSIERMAVCLKPGTVIVVKSTVPVGTSTRIERQLSRLGRNDLSVASFPEFLREGSAVQDTLFPSRLVFGVSDENAEYLLRALYPNSKIPVIVCDRTTAEMVKYSSNAYLATKISFINEIANICLKVGADVQTVAEGMGYDPRIGGHFLKAGIGYGGSCFPKDTRALVRLADDIDYDFRVLKSVVEINQRQRMAPIRALRTWFPDLSGKVVGILGVAFKPGTDDIRESPALDLALELLSLDADLKFCDPVVDKTLRIGSRMYNVFRDPYETLSGCDAAILVTEWQQFASLDWSRVKRTMRLPYLFDGRNFWNPADVLDAGFMFENMGRGVQRRMGTPS